MTITIANVIVIVLLTYFSKYLVELAFNWKQLKNVQYVNKKLEQMRTIPVKTLEEQNQTVLNQENFIDEFCFPVNFSKDLGLKY